VKPKDETGMVGKLLAVWLILLVVLIVAVLDTSAILLAHFHTSDVATNAASAAANEFKDTGNVNLACQAAADTIRSGDPNVTLIRKGCKVNPTTGEVRITVVRHVNTFVAWRLGITKKYVTITDSITATPGL
jgi:hypothetical protein